MIESSKIIPRAESPEEVGVSSAGIAAILNDFEKNSIENHSLMIIRHGKVAFEAWRKPYGPDLLHIMYSVSKSVISAAAGFAVAEGLLTLDTKLLDVFPEYRNPTVDPETEDITLRHLLTMTAGKSIGLITDKTSPDWVRDFINAKQGHKPGTNWNYISENTYCVAAMIVRKAGMSVTEYLTPRLYEPLGIKSTQWERDSKGIETGGWGLFLRTEDLAKIALCHLNSGRFNGKQIIPEGWCDLASENHVEGIEGAPEKGYGFFIWGFSQGFRFDGMFSQFAYCFPEKDAVIISTNNEVNEGKAHSCLESNLDKLFFDGEAPEPCQIPEIPDLESLAKSERQPETEKAIDGKTIKISGNPLLSAMGFPLSVLSFPAIYMSADKAGPIDNVKFNFYQDECTMYWTEGDESNIIHIGLDGKARNSRIVLGKLCYTAHSSGAWLSKNKLEIRIRPLESVCERRLVFTFKGNSVTMSPSSIPTLKTLSEELLPTLDYLVPSQAANSAMKIIISGAYRLLDADQKGKIQ